MGKIIAIANQKGGVGKTTTTINVGAALAFANKKVLIVDLDEQANATIGLGLARELIEISTYGLLTKDESIHEAIYRTNLDNLNIIPSSKQLSKVEIALIDKEDKELLLSKKLEEIRDDYDYILLDCPPSCGVIVYNALFASDSVIIPVECEFFAYDALTQMVNIISEVQTKKKYMNKTLTIEGVLLNKLDNRSTFGFGIVDKVKEQFPAKTFKTIIYRSSHLEAAPMYGKSVLEYSYNSKASKDYRSLALEIIGNE